MGNQASQLGDEPTTAIAQKNLQHFDHSFKADLHTTSGPVLTEIFGVRKFAKRPILITCKAQSIMIVEEIGITSKTTAELVYSKITAVSWDHANSEVKIAFKGNAEIQNAAENFVIMTMANSIEFEGELKLRLAAMVSATQHARAPTVMYVGVFAGATKPKPFQRKRPNLSQLPAGKLPTLHAMRSMAVDLHRGSYRPCSQGSSRRKDIALQHIYEGVNTFPLLSVRGASSVSSQYRADSLLVISDEALIFKPRGNASDSKVEFSFEDIADWSAIDNDNHRSHDSGIEIVSGAGDKVYFGVEHVRDVKHTLEYFWNKFKVANGKASEVKLGSTHGRPIVSVATLSGDMPPPVDVHSLGQSEVIDQDGLLVRPGGRIAPRRTSIAESIAQGGANKDLKVVPPENKDVKGHWHKVVLHQGWLLKQGGVGVGSGKSWLKRYFVLYKTSQGHFLVYYSDFTECPMYSSEQNHRNYVDLAKCTFIRPGSNKQDNPDTPPHSFDIVTIERDWTLCAESQENAQRWLKLLTRAVDEDVAILPDEELVFKVKPKVDPLGVLPSTDYSTSLKVSAHGISVCTPVLNPKDPNNMEVEHYFWVYTDFYKWSLLSQAGKLALLVNVFADASFSRRIEYIFRNKEAQRLATAIEFFIEKFMSLMHIRLETTDGAFDDAAATAGAAANSNNTNQSSSSGSSNTAAASSAEPTRLHALNAEDVAQENHFAEELDLLGLDYDGGSSSPVPASHYPNHATTAPTTTTTSASSGISLFDEPFGAAAPVPPPAPVAASSGLSLFDEPFGAVSAPAPPAAVVQPAASQSVNLFSDDDIFGGGSSSSNHNNSDPFGNDLFGSSSSAPVAVAAPVPVVKVAPPLTAHQLTQHRQWMLAAVAANGGPIYDDGTLHIACKVEIRGSQCRFSFQYTNHSPAALTEFAVSVVDPAGLLRYELSPFPSDQLAGMGHATQVLMLECIKPAAPGPQLSLSYKDSLQNARRSNTLVDLPLVVTSFNEPLSLGPEDFANRWQMLIGAGQEHQEVIKPSHPVIPAQIHSALVSTLKYGRTQGLPDATEFIIYGAASLKTGALSPNGDKISVGCMLKIEMNVQANAMRLTLRTVHPAATVAVMQTIKSLLL